MIHVVDCLLNDLGTFLPLYIFFCVWKLCCAYVHVLELFSSPASAPVNGICLESPCPLSPGTLDEHNLLKASDVAFTSLPTMHLDEQQEGGILQNNQMLPSDYDGRMLPRSCPEPIACKKSTLYTNVRYDSRSSPLSQCKAQRRIYCTYWSNEAVTRGLEVCLSILYIWSFRSIS